jgi:1-acyl-sn-glycerol-3-phosphate acyltransferase
MIEAAKNWWLEEVFWVYLRWTLKRSFHDIVVIGDVPKLVEGVPVILAPNHISWWDGFFAYIVNRQLFRRTFYLLMLEKELSKRPFFRALGCFSLSPGKTRQTFRYLSQLIIDQPNALITYFPEGEIRTDVQEKLFVREGLRLLRTDHRVGILPTCFRIEPLNNRLPTVFIRFGEILDLKNFQERPSLLGESLNATREVLHNHLEDSYSGVQENWAESSRVKSIISLLVPGSSVG